MTDLTIALQLVALVVLLALSACFSMSETVMMAANRYRLRALASQGNRGAGLAIDLLARTVNFPYELPVGTISGVLGGVIFLVLLLTGRMKTR